MRRVAALFAGPVMTLAGINHFVMPQVYASIVPDSLPAPGGARLSLGTSRDRRWPRDHAPADTQTFARDLVRWSHWPRALPSSSLFRRSSW